MAIKLNERALAKLLNSYTGPVGREVGLVAELVAVTARQNASNGGPFGESIGIVTGRLIGGIKSTPHREDGEAAYIVGTDAKSDTGFGYPAFHDVGGSGTIRGGQRRWLTGALREVFTE